MSFPQTITRELTALGCTASGRFSFWLPVPAGTGTGTVRWHLGFRTLGFAKDQIDAALRYRHPQATDFGWHCLAHFAGPRWRTGAPPGPLALSGGLAVGPLAGWRSNHTFDNRGLAPDDAARQVAADIHDHVLPFAARHHDDAALHALLARDEEPFPWFRSQGLTRLAEMAWLEAAMGMAAGSVAHLALAQEMRLQGQLDGLTVPDYVASVLQAAREVLR